MNSGGDGYPEWFLWMVERGLFFWLVAIGMPVLLVFGMALYLGWRLDEIDEHVLQYRPPLMEAAERPGAATQPATAGATVYVPAYSHIYHSGGRPILLEATLSIRNTSENHPITIQSVRYSDTAGQLVNVYLDAPLRLAPLATTEFLVKARDTKGGSGANFLVRWTAATDVAEPVIETIMVGVSGDRSLAFARPGRVLTRVTPPASR
jgi:uncharacterized protein DUF3124